MSADRTTNVVVFHFLFRHTHTHTSRVLASPLQTDLIGERQVTEAEANQWARQRNMRYRSLRGNSFRIQTLTHICECRPNLAFLLVSKTIGHVTSSRRMRPFRSVSTFIASHRPNPHLFHAYYVPRAQVFRPIGQERAGHH
jgi:hypothetical protein